MIWRLALSLFLRSGIIILGIYIDIGRSRQDRDIPGCGPITLGNYAMLIGPRFAFGNGAVVQLMKFTEKVRTGRGFLQARGQRTRPLERSSATENASAYTMLSHPIAWIAWG
jgi:hypothetical protein